MLKTIATALLLTLTACGPDLQADLATVGTGTVEVTSADAGTACLPTGAGLVHGSHMKCCNPVCTRNSKDTCICG